MSFQKPSELVVYWLCSLGIYFARYSIDFFQAILRRSSRMGARYSGSNISISNNISCTFLLPTRNIHNRISAQTTAKDRTVPLTTSRLRCFSSAADMPNDALSSRNMVLQMVIVYCMVNTVNLLRLPKIGAEAFLCKKRSEQIICDM